VKVGDIAEMRKAHACGSFHWEVTRVGLEIGIKCLKCGRLVKLERTYFNRRLRRLTESNSQEATNDGG
jgi:hypothetical protein